MFAKIEYFIDVLPFSLSFDYTLLKHLSI